MKRSEKGNVIAKLSTDFQRSHVFILTDYSGMQVSEIQSVKNALRKSKGTLKIVKNRLAVRAAAGTPLEKVQKHFKGPVALVLGFDDMIGPIKTLTGLLKDQAKLKVKVGVLEGQVMDIAGIEAVSKLPHRTEMVGQLAVRMKSPLYGLASTLGGIVSQFARVLNAVKTLKN